MTDRRYIEIADFFTPRGYVTVLQDLRDRYRSEGRGEYFHRLQRARRPRRLRHHRMDRVAARGRTARVGTVGSSFAGLVQTAGRVRAARRT